jgi:hypothetical protein
MYAVVTVLEMYFLRCFAHFLLFQEPSVQELQKNNWWLQVFAQYGYSEVVT